MTRFTSSQHSFKNPPVYETALSVQFDELPGFSAVHFGEFHEIVRKEFPVAKDAARLQEVHEYFPFRASRIVLREQPVQPNRVMYCDAVDPQRLLQLQPDRIGYNWRRSDSGKPYPRFDDYADRFVSFVEQFKQFCSDRQLGEVTPNLVEVTYVNRIECHAKETPSGCLNRVFGLSETPNDTFLPAPEQTSLRRMFSFHDLSGRLYTEVDTQADHVLQRLIARINVTRGEDFTGPLQLAHDWVTDAFVALSDVEARESDWQQEVTL
ncbi:TIGR04255 family protein [Fuerstiella marisgermanici]|uniref:TIGR04255 family protein n=1 Tax=Fuerstiella marisgermanici TaxID=1891926 RepID=A0A1P8WMQ0_9PLAN|nr:TIGR04255 family protein [Fuerstiella marisgermanici]APZ95345.1 hypothetical protein Fuma_05001 [Fuerstiella marisgermanici]